MNKDFLSQEEIDALISGTAKTSIEPDLNPDDYLTLFDRDALGEIGNISFGTAATTLSTLLRQKVLITTPSVTLLRSKDVARDFPIPHIAAKVEYTEGLIGSNVLAIRLDDAKIIADLMLGGDGKAPVEEINELHLSAVAEAMNQMMGSAATSMSSMLNRAINISPPTVDIIDFSKQSGGLLSTDAEVMAKISFHLQVGDLIDSTIMQLVPTDFASTLVRMLMEASHSDGNSSASATHVPERPVAPAPYAETFPASIPSASLDHTNWGDVNRQQVAMKETPNRAQPPVVEKALFSEFDESTSAGNAGRNLDLLLDIPLALTVELGRTKKLIRDILDLTPGSVVELDTLAGEPVDILVNNKLVARGEVVVIDENFGVRVTDILTPVERIRRLQ